ncbi:MAG TPA: LysR substrate-binding domain-containing protein [Phenylobacterium sp.]|uniref:LysR substrate-binding domain-containing protein n=1 Tax=Phenylobacterium sp. TaxID=1871053 RepID=UPI002B49117B|nr:LysR substrate-binding domain-containing protein [Phenylobacterium sp.]HKR86727.1 LysR substrate-binding domain-containing protein [Phenylobacterium sp.]
MRQFVAVAEELHFGRAARRLNMAQPPLSQAIRRLELELGLDLFDRSKRAVELTDAGRVFLAEARRTLMQADLARKLTQRAAAGTLDVRVSFIGAALYRVIPALLLKHREAHPDVHVHLFERFSSEQIKDVLAGELDVGFATGITEHMSGLATLVVERGAYIAAVPRSWDLAQQDSVRLTDLVDHPFIQPPKQYASDFSEPLEMLKSIGIAPRQIQETTQSATTLSLIGAGLGCSILSSNMVHVMATKVKFLPIVDAPPHRPWELMMIWSSQGLTPSTAQFVETAKSFVEEHPALLDIAGDERLLRG